VVKVDAVMLMPESLNRSIAQCTDNGLPAVCINVNVCFRVRGKQIPGNIGKTVLFHQIYTYVNLNLKSGSHFILSGLYTYIEINNLIQWTYCVHTCFYIVLIF